MINTLPGVTMQSGTLATGRIVIRGMGSRTPYNTNRIRAYLDGIPLTGADGVSSPEELDFASLGRVEVTRGPSSALYGSGLGGALPYTPRLPASIQGRSPSATGRLARPRQGCRAPSGTGGAPYMEASATSTATDSGKTTSTGEVR